MKDNTRDLIRILPTDVEGHCKLSSLKCLRLSATRIALSSLLITATALLLLLPIRYSKRLVAWLFFVNASSVTEATHFLAQNRDGKFHILKKRVALVKNEEKVFVVNRHLTYLYE